MKHLNLYIQEKLHISNYKKQEYNYHPKTRDELEDLVNKLIIYRGNNADLNDIDTSKITDISYLFAKYDENNDNRDKCFSEFNGDISKWDVSNVKNMSNIFYHSNFNRDILKWDVSNVENMSWIFANSNFNCDISKWDVSNVEDMSCMFYNSKFNGNISKWDVRKVNNINDMFRNSEFNQNINNWKIRKSKCRNRMKNVFDNSPLEKNPPIWYK